MKIDPNFSEAAAGGRHPALAAALDRPAESGALDFLRRDERVPAGRAGRRDLRLARRGRPGGAPALDPRRRRPDALPARAGHRRLAAAARRRRSAGGSSTSSGSRGTAARNGCIDPLNPSRAGDPFGENSVCRTWGYERPEWSRPQGAPAGHIEPLPIESDVFGETREERVYLPAGYDAGRQYPLVVIHDGTDYVTYADLATSLDNLIAAGDLPPLIAVLVQTRDRMAEYAGGRRHARYLVQEVLPTVATRFGVSRDPAERVLLGASLGAVASLVDRVPLSRRVRRAGAQVRLVHPRRAQARGAAAPGVPPHRAPRSGAAPGARAAQHPRLRLDRRARGAGRPEPRPRRVLALARRRCSVQVGVGRAPLAQLARPAPRRPDVGPGAPRPS